MLEISLQDLQDPGRYSQLKQSYGSVIPRLFSAFDEAQKTPKDFNDFLQKHYGITPEQFSQLRHANITSTNVNELSRNNQGTQEFMQAMYKDYLPAFQANRLNADKNLVDAVNASLRPIMTRAQQYDDVVINGYEEGSQQFDSRKKEYDTLLGQIPEYLRSQLPQIGSGFSGGMSDMVGQAGQKAATGGTTNITSGTDNNYGIQIYKTDDGLLHVYEPGIHGQLVAKVRRLDKLPTGQVAKNISWDELNRLSGGMSGSNISSGEVGGLINQYKTSFDEKANYKTPEQIDADLVAAGTHYYDNDGVFKTTASGNNSAPSGGTTVGIASVAPSTTPGHKGVYTGKESGTSTDLTTNYLFKQYYGRDANITELNQWRNQTVGALEASLASGLANQKSMDGIKNTQIDPYYKQLTSQYQSDVTKNLNRNYEDRVRQLQTENVNMADNIKKTQGGLEASGMTFTGDAISKLGTLSAFGQSSPTGTPNMTAAQMGIEGSVNQANRLFAESSRSKFNQGLENIGQDAIRYLGTAGVAKLGLPSQMIAGQPQTTGTLQYQYNNSLQSVYGNLANQEGTLTDYQKLFL